METRVCPFCGEPPGEGVFCAACGRNLGAIEQLPTRAEWEAEHPPATEGPLPERCAAAIAAFLAAMHAAGDPGAKPIAKAGRSMFRRAPEVDGWVVRPVDREDFEEPRRYEAGLFLAVDGSFHRLDSELRGWGQRSFPHYEHTISAEPIDPPVDPRLIGELGAVLGANGVEALS